MRTVCNDYLFIVTILIQVRKELGIGDNVKVLIINFGGQVRYQFFYFIVCILLGAVIKVLMVCILLIVQPAGWKLKQEWLPVGWLCLV